MSKVTIITATTGSNYLTKNILSVQAQTYPDVQHLVVVDGEDHVFKVAEQLEMLNIELENIQSSLSQGMVIVDRNLCIIRFSPLAVRVFGLVESDVGQPLIGVPTTVPLVGLREGLLAVVNGEGRRTIEAASEDVAYFTQIMPYVDHDGSNHGAIITLTDVSELVSLRRAAEASLSEFERLADALEQVVWKRDHTMSRLLYVSRRIEMLGGWTTDEILQHPELLDDAIQYLAEMGEQTSLR